MPVHNIKFEDIPEDRKAYSPDRKYVVTWYIEKTIEDRYEEKIFYHIDVFDVRTKKLVRRIATRYNYDYQFREESGTQVHSAEFSEDGKYIILNRDKRDKIPFNPKIEE